MRLLNDRIHYQQNFEYASFYSRICECVAYATISNIEKINNQNNLSLLGAAAVIALPLPIY